MSNMFSGANASLRSRTLPDGETVGRYGSYLDAQKAVDYLADHDFPVQHVSIVGNDLKSVEVVTGKLSYPRVALSGAASGAMFGLFIGFIFSLFGGNGGLAALIPSVLIGAVFWMIIGVISYAMQGGKRDFSSTSQVIASSFDVVVDREVSGQARSQLQNLQVGQLPEQRQGQQYGGQQYGGQQQGGQQFGGQQQRPPYGPPQYGPPQGGPQGGQGRPPQAAPYGQRPPQGAPQAGPWAPPQPGQPPAGRPAPGQQGGPQQGGPRQPGRPQQGQSPQGGPYTGAAYQPQGGRPPARGDQPFDGQRQDAVPSRDAASDDGRSTPRGQFPDLPDGRPQYGVRVDEGQRPAPGRAAGASATGATAAGGRSDHRDNPLEDRVNDSENTRADDNDDARLAERPAPRPGAAADDARPAETSSRPIDTETGAVTEGESEEPAVNSDPLTRDPLTHDPEQRDR
ncbi:general stress protein [Tersicoccus sp. MR15.9]|uniref:general stress protein n=1 Tax=Tersicoccus mangrovi TaxID=3121635 RepID=UPI002FE60AD6